MKEVEKLQPRAFTKFCMSIAQVPSSYIAGLTIEEQLLWFCSYLEKNVIPAVNNNAEAVEELQTLYTQLQSYVEHYFDNLDVQEEINNKLDDMAESGELTDIIAQYLELAGVLAYDTKAAMKAAENIAEGSICKTLGNLSYSDGKGAFYKVRQVQNTDVIDDDNIIALSDPDLVAEKIPYSSGYENIETIKSDIPKNILIIGDSYTSIYDNAWGRKVSQQLGLNLFTFASGGIGFCTDGTSFNTKLTEATNQMSELNRIRTKYIIVYGGINDQSQTAANIRTAIETLYNNAKTNFPNAQLLIVGPQAGVSNYGSFNLQRTQRAMKDACSKNGISYSDSRDWLTNTAFDYTTVYDTDLYHPSETIGNNVIASNMLCLIAGQYTTYSDINMAIATGTSTANDYLRISPDRNKIHIECYMANCTLIANDYTTVINSSNINSAMHFIKGKQPLTVYKMDDYGNIKEIIGYAYFRSNTGSIQCVYYNSSNYNGKVLIVGDLYFMMNDQDNGYSA